MNRYIVYFMIWFFLVFVLAGFIGYSLRSSKEEPSDHVIIPANMVDLTNQGYLKKSIGTDNITIKYIDDVGWVVKWEDGAILAGNKTMPAKWIQRFEPWLQEVTGVPFNVTWEE